MNFIKDPNLKTLTKPLKSGHELTVSENPESDIILIKNTKGIILFSLEINGQGTTLHIDSENISINALKNITLSAENINIESKKNTFIKSEGDFQQYVKGNKTSETQGNSIDTAKTQHIKAFLGDVKLKANDDIKLNGERVKLNCD